MTGTPSHPSLDHIEDPVWDSTPDYSPRKRRFVHITRCVRPDDIPIIDAIADDGTAWTYTGSAIAGAVGGWRQIAPLPDRED